mgnify:CR=1 FL=1
MAAIEGGCVGSRSCRATLHRQEGSGRAVQPAPVFLQHNYEYLIHTYTFTYYNYEYNIVQVLSGLKRVRVCGMATLYVTCHNLFHGCCMANANVTYFNPFSASVLAEAYLLISLSTGNDTSISFTCWYWILQT